MSPPCSRPGGLEHGGGARLLFCLRYGIGDLVMELPILDALRRHGSGASIHALGALPAIDLLKGDSRVDGLTAVQDLGVGHWADPGTEEVRQGIAGWLEAGGFDRILDPSHAAAAVRDVIFATGAPAKDCSSRAQRDALRRGAGGAVAIAAGAEEAWGLAVDRGASPRLELRAEDFEEARVLLPGGSERGGPLIGFCLEASSPLKRWPPERFGQVAARLAEDAGAKILLFSGPEPEPELFELFCSAAPAGSVLALRDVPLRTAAALLGRSSLLLCNDTGLMHLGAATGTTVAAIFGPTLPSIYLPRSIRSQAFWAGTACPHRLLDDFGPPACVLRGECLLGLSSCTANVAVDEVHSAVRKLLRPAGSR
jgi:ADP-heptose:LPS heptosyltransferase